MPSHHTTADYSLTAVRCAQCPDTTPTLPTHDKHTNTVDGEKSRDDDGDHGYPLVITRVRCDVCMLQGSDDQISSLFDLNRSISNLRRKKETPSCYFCLLTNGRIHDASSDLFETKITAK